MLPASSFRTQRKFGFLNARCERAVVQLLHDHMVVYLLSVKSVRYEAECDFGTQALQLNSNQSSASGRVKQKQRLDLDLTFDSDGAFNFICLCPKQYNLGLGVKRNLLDVKNVNL